VRHGRDRYKYALMTFIKS